MYITTHRAMHLLLLLLLIVDLPTYKGMESVNSISDKSTSKFNQKNPNTGNTKSTENNQDNSKHISDLLSSAQQVSVLVVGGGVSGLSTVETLLNNGVDCVILLEASDRLGGRVQTIRRDGVLVEGGAEWIHGDQPNPVYKIANKLDAVGKNVPDSEIEWMLVNDNGEVQDEDWDDWELMYQLVTKTDELVSYYHTGIGQFFIDKFHETFGDKANTTKGRALFHALEQTVNSYEGINNWLDTSTRDVDNWVDYGEDHQWKNGYDTLINYTLSNISNSNIHLSNPVSEVYWDQDLDDGVLVVTSNGVSFLAQHVVFTTSVAYLQKNHQHIFTPPLPKSYIKSLDGISLNVADKIQIGWDTPWWSNTNKPLSVYIMWETMDLPKEMAWLYDVVQIFSVYQQPNILQMFVTGDNAKTMENLTEDQVKSHVMYILGRIIKKSVPQPIFFNRSQWGLNPWVLGSYSSFITLAGEKEGLHNKKPLAEPLYNSRGKIVLGWAGEHTHSTRFSCVDGARQTGIREANRILELINAKGGARASVMSLLTTHAVVKLVVLTFMAVFVV